MEALAKIAPAPGSLEIIDRAERAPGPGEVRVRVCAASICGTDLEIYRWQEWMAPIMGDSLPVVIGHEFAGTVDAVGDDVDSALVGALVAAESHLACHRCPVCLAGRPHLCLNTKYVGFSFDGGFAESTVIPLDIVREVPVNVSPRQAALLEPFGLAVRAVDRGDGVAGKSVLITGAGPLGVMAAMVARVRGATAIVLTEASADRRVLAERVLTAAPPDAIVAGDVEATTLAVSELTGGAGVDVWIDFAGVQGTLDAGIASLARGGEGRLVGLGTQTANINLATTVMHELRLYPMHGRLLDDTWTASLELLRSGTVDLGPIITDELPLARYEDAFGIVAERRGMKVLFNLDGGA